MKRFIAAFAFLCCCGVCFAQSSQAVGKIQKEFETDDGKNDVLLESSDIKSLVLKYDAAPSREKPAIKKQIETIQLGREENDIKAQDMRIKRQEEKIKELRAQLEQRKKNKEKNVKAKTEMLLSRQSVSKIKAESRSQKMKDKVKSKFK